MHKQSKSRSKANDFNPLSSRKFLIKFSPEENVSSYYQKWVWGYLSSSIMQGSIFASKSTIDDKNHPIPDFPSPMEYKQ